MFPEESVVRRVGYTAPLFSLYGNVNVTGLSIRDSEDAKIATKFTIRDS